MPNVTTLLYDPQRGFRVWNMTEIYQGPTSVGIVVPNIDDLVIDWNQGTFRVTAIDNTTKIATMVFTNLATLQNQQNGAGLALNLASYQPSVIELAFVNTQAIPHTITIDDRYRCYGSNAQYMKLFKGTDISADTGVVISQTFDNAGTFISENVTLEQIDPSNTAIKRPPLFYTNVALQDGEEVTVVIYSATGGAMGQHHFLVKNTNAIRGLGNNTKYITDITLESTMMDQINPNLINAFANVPITGGDFQARLHYNDGSSEVIAVGTAKCHLYGLDDFNTSLAGTTSKVVLAYYPESTEPTINISNPTNNSITHVYDIHTVNNVLDHSFKIYVVPSYNTTSGLYEMEYYLTNLAYDILIKLLPNQITVTKFGGGVINYMPNSGPQKFNLSVHIADVIPFGFAGYTFVQAVTVTFNPLTNVGWIIDYLNTGANVYGAQAYFAFSTQTNQAISIQSGALTVDEWLARLWLPMHAIYDETVRLAPPRPTHFQLTRDGLFSPIRSIDDYFNLVLPNDFPTGQNNGQTLSLIFLESTSDIGVYKKLAVAPVICKNTLT